MKTNVTLPNIKRPDYSWGVIVLAPLLIFALFLLLQGVNPLTIYGTMLTATFGDYYGMGEVIIKTTPLILTALATALSSKAGLVNVGGEGQLAIGALFTTGAAVYLFKDMPGVIAFPLLIISGALGGAVWSGIAAVLRVKGRMNETITTLLMNYIAYYLVSYFVYGPLKDPASFNWPFSPQLKDSLRLPTLPGSRVNIGIIIAIAAVVIVWFFISKTKLGYRLRVIGGNPLAALHAGYNVARVQLWTMVISGGIAGIAGMIEITGIEGRLRPTTGVNYGYLGFLAAWMAWNNPGWSVVTCFIIGMISVAGNSLEMNSGLPSSSVQILMALVLFGILWAGRRDKR